jgi:hypothetical protein
MWDDEELAVLWRVTAELMKLKAEPEAQIRILQYVKDRLGLPVLLIKARSLVPDVERCEEIEPDIYIG